MRIGRLEEVRVGFIRVRSVVIGRGDGIGQVRIGVEKSEDCVMQVGNRVRMK